MRTFIRTKNLQHKIRATIHNGRLLCESIRAVHEAHQLHNSLDLVKVTDVVLQGCAKIQTNKFSSLVTLLYCKLLAHLAKNEGSFSWLESLNNTN